MNTRVKVSRIINRSNGTIMVRIPAGRVPTQINGIMTPGKMINGIMIKNGKITILGKIIMGGKIRVAGRITGRSLGKKKMIAISYLNKKINTSANLGSSGSKKNTSKIKIKSTLAPTSRKDKPKYHSSLSIKISHIKTQYLKNKTTKALKMIITWQS